MSNERNDRDNNDRTSAGEVARVERALAQFSPRTANVDRDRLMFLAGAASTLNPVAHGRVSRADAADKRAWQWPAATAALAATSLALAVALFLRPEPQLRIVYQDRPAAVATAEPPAAAPAVVEVLPPEFPRHVAVPTVARRTSLTQPSSARRDLPGSNYLQTREVALRMGLDALGTPRSSGGTSGSAPTYFDWLSGLADSPARTEQPEALPRSKM